MESNSSKSNAVVVIGGGFGGLTTAFSLSNGKKRPPIILIEPRKRFVFLPLLYELLAGELETWEVAPSYKSLLASRGIIHIDQYVENIDLDKEIVITSNGEEIKYGKLVISTGSQPDSFGIPGVEEYALMFNQYQDVAKIKNLILSLNNSPNQNLFIVGAGPTGVELACKLADLIVQPIAINLVELGERVLPNVKSFNQEQAEQALRKKSVKVHLNTRVLKITREKLEFLSILQDQSKSLSMSHSGVIWTAGVKSSIPNGLPKNILKDRKILINSQLNVIGYDNVFAIGDISYDLGNPLFSTAQVAMQQGEHLGVNLRDFFDGKIVNRPFQFVDRGEMLSLGVGQATLTAMGLTMSGSLAFQIRRMAYLSKFPNLSLGVRSAGSWLCSHAKNLID